jgi:hypothetical protein
MQHKTVELGGFWPIKDPANIYGIIKDQKTSYNIYSFSQLGWPDPFPKPLLEGDFIDPPAISDN